MHPLSRIFLVALLVLCTASPSMAKLATIEATAPLNDQSEQAVKEAIVEVVRTVAQGALAMGLSWVKVNQVLVLDDHVQVRVLATDVKPEEEPATNPNEDEETLGDLSSGGTAAPLSRL
jgi:hypothetical protein